MAVMYGLTVDECRRVVEIAGGDPAAVDAPVLVSLVGIVGFVVAVAVWMVAR